jgi:cysteine desulfurase family protein (TIGR01976 family)
MSLDLSFVRDQFPALSGSEIFLDNAGGSLTLERVADRVRDYLLSSDVQLGATYRTSEIAAERYAEARRRLAGFIGAGCPESVVFGPSSTILLGLLARGFAGCLGADDEIVVTRTDHESNIGCWLDLAQRSGARVHWWERNAESGELELSDLAKLLGARTRLVCFAHVSNILGTLNPVAEITQLVHEHGARVCVDGVAYAPHRPVDVTAWDVDFYVISLYKVYGPHHAMLYGRPEALRELDSVNHYFVDKERLPGKLEPGNANYELSHGAAGIVDYFDELDRRHAGRAWSEIAIHEELLARRLLDFLSDHPRMSIVGQQGSGRDCRVPTISFIHSRREPTEIVAALDRQGIGARYGHFYAARLIDDLGLADRGGVLRVSMVHYNTLDEIDRLISCLDEF